MKECPKCHTMLEDDDLFCPECGTKYEEVAKGKGPDFPTTITGLDTIVSKHLEVASTNSGKTVTTLLSLQTYPDAYIQLISSDGLGFVVDVALERKRGEGTLIARIKASELYPLFSADDDSNNDFFATMEIGHQDSSAVVLLSKLLTEVYEQPIGVLPGFVICVNGKAIELGESKKQTKPEPSGEKSITQGEELPNVDAQVKTSLDDESILKTQSTQQSEEKESAEELTEKEISSTKFLLLIAKTAALAIIVLPFINVGTSFGIGWYILIVIVGLVLLAMFGTDVKTKEDKSMVKFCLILLAIIAAVMYFWGPLNDRY